MQTAEDWFVTDACGGKLTGCGVPSKPTLGDLSNSNNMFGRCMAGYVPRGSGETGNSTRQGRGAGRIVKGSTMSKKSGENASNFDTQEKLLLTKTSTNKNQSSTHRLTTPGSAQDNQAQNLKFSIRSSTVGMSKRSGLKGSNSDLKNQYSSKHGDPPKLRSNVHVDEPTTSTNEDAFTDFDRKNTEMKKSRTEKVKTLIKNRISSSTGFNVNGRNEDGTKDQVLRGKRTHKVIIIGSRGGSKAQRRTTS